MPGKIKVKVLAGRNLPVMDRASDTTDAFVEIKFGGITHKTDVCRKSLNPHWSSTEWYRFEVDESELQDEPLQLRLMDHDTYSANDAIGKVVISLAPLLAREANNAKGTTGPPGGAVLSGWIPVFDTMHGIRGELNVIVKVELFSDFNKYKTSSCGVQFFHCPMIPPGYKATSIHGFVEELVVNDDPEYQWIDKIRTPRASNEARQVAFIKLSNQVQRLVGLKAAELGANAVVGYQQEFDLEGEAGVVARAIGTAVSITPMPTASQPVNMISCTQQQLKKCLDILATENDSVTDLSQYYQHHQEELQKMINLLNPKGLSMLDSQEIPDDDEEKVGLVRQSSLNSYAGSVSLYQDEHASRNSLRHLSEDQTDLNRLLNRKDDDDSDSSSGPIQKIKKLKTNFFTKRFTKRKGDKKNEKQDDAVSLKSNSSDTSRISLYDIKNELQKFKRLKKPKFVKAINKEDEGEGMASILARSVIHARTTLACITETQDSQAENSPSSTLRRTSESDPNIHVEEEKPKKISVQEKVETDVKKVPNIQFSSLKNITTEDSGREPRVRRLSESCPTSPVAGRSDNLLKLPGDKGYYGSVSSALSGESSIYSSSEDEDESSDLKTDTDEALETTSSIVKSVMKQEADPAFIALMDRKLTVIQNTPPKISEGILADFDKRFPESLEVGIDKIEFSKVPEKQIKDFECKVEKAEDDATKIEPVEATNEPSTSKDAEKCVPKPNSHYIKIHNPFAHRKTSASISCPSSPVEKHNFVYRSSKRIKDKLSVLSNSHMIKSISHISLFHKKKEPKTLSQPGSTSDVPSFPSKYPSETVLGSHFLSYSDLLGLDKDIMQANKLCKSDEIRRSKFSMYIGSEPVSRCSISGPSHPHSRDEHELKRDKLALKPTGLIHTAMETMLIEKVEALLIPTSPEINVNTKFFDDVSEKLEEHKNSGATMRQLQSTTASTTPRIVAVTPKRLSEDLTAKVDKLIDKKHQEESQGLGYESMETMLMDKAHAAFPEATENIHSTSLHDDFYSEKYTAMHKKKDSKGSISTLMDKVHFHPHFLHHKKDGTSHDIKSGGLIQAAMQTMLIDRAQTMIPDTPDPIPIHAEPDFGEIGKHHKHHEHNHKNKESTGLVHSALQTILIDNVQSVLPDSDEPIPIRTEPDFGEETHTSHGRSKEKESTGLVHSALQTMLIDNVQSVLPDSDEPIPIRTEPIFDDATSQKSHSSKESTGLVHSALQTMLIDNIQSVLPVSEEPIPIRVEPIFDDTKSQKSYGKDKESTGLVHSELQTLLIDNVQSVLSDSKEPIPIRIEQIIEDTESQKSYGKDKESTGLVHSALQTMLIDNVQSVLPDSEEPIPIRIEQIFDDAKFQKSNEKDKESTGLVHSALQTMLIDNVQSVLSDSKEPIPIRIEQIIEDRESQKSYGKDKESTGLVYSALQTMLIDNVQSVLPESEEPIPIRVEPNNEKSYEEDTESKSKDLANTAMETILIDRMQTMFPKAPEAKETRIEKNKDEFSELKSTGLVKNAMQTILVDKLNPVVEPDKFIFNKSNDKNDTFEFKETEANVDVIGKVQSERDTNKRVKENYNAIDPKINKIQTTNKVDDSKLKSWSKDNISDPAKDKNEEINKQKETKEKQVKETETRSKEKKEKKTFEERNKHFTRQDSVNSVTSNKMSKEANKHQVTKALLQHFHPSLKELETIPSVDSNDSFDRSVDDSARTSGVEGSFDRSDAATVATTEASVDRTGGSLNTSAGNNVGSGGGAILRPSMNSNNLDMLEYPFLTMTEYPPGFIVHIGGAVCARSVKLVDGGGESAARAAWWTELRIELRAHARALRCNAVIAYRDSAAICEDVCVLSASGTAVVINLDCDFNADIEAPITVPNGSKAPFEENEDSCSIAHVPYSPGAGPYRAELSTCGGCRRARVPAVLLAACAKPNKLAAYPKSVTLTAVAARIRRAPPSAEPGARDISDQLPFLEYELHKLLLAKLRMQGANAIFSLQTQIAIGERCVMALASGQAVKLTALPPPTPPRIKASEKEKDAIEMQKALWDTFTANRAANGYDVAGIPEQTAYGALPELEHEEPPALDLCADKDACVLELDEAEDVETARALSKRRVHLQAYNNSLRPATGAQPLAFTQVSRGRLVLSSGVGCSAGAERQVARALDGAAYKLRRLAPAALLAAFHIELPEDEIQLVVSGTAIPLADPTKPDPSENGHSQASQSSQSSQHCQSSQNSQTDGNDDDIFELDEEQMKPVLTAQEMVEDKSVVNGQVGSAVSLSTLSAVGLGRARRLCALRLLFVRETTAVRELGGLSGFLHTFTCEVLAILRAYTAALGGNALTSFYITQLMLQDNAHKNQGQCLLSVGGDVVHVTY